MEVVGALSNHELRGQLLRLAKKLAVVRAGCAVCERRSCRRRSHRPGWVLKAIVQVLTDRGEPMRAKDIHTAVEALLGEPVVVVGQDGTGVQCLGSLPAVRPGYEGTLCIGELCVATSHRVTAHGRRFETPGGCR
jgi:hypothetical protein